MLSSAALNKYKKQILFVNGNLKVGGVEMALSSLLNCIDFNKFEVDLLLLQDGYDYEPDLPNSIRIIKINLDKAQGPFISSIFRNTINRDWNCVSYRVINLFSRFFSKEIFRFFKISKNLRPSYDIVVSFRPGICADLASLSINAPVKICWWHHGNIEINIPKTLIEEQLNRFDRIITVSDGARQMLASSLTGLKKSIEVIPNILDINNITCKANEYAPYNNFPIDHSVIKIVSVSRLSAEKNVIGLIEAAKSLKSNNINFIWHIIGDGECMTSIRNKISEYNLESFIFMDGSQSNPYPWIKGADVMIHPSPVESFGLVILEAMALGVPCIAVKSIGSRQLINGHNGIIVKDMSTINSAIMSILDPERQEKIVKNGLLTAKEYSPLAVYQKFESILNK